MTITRHGKGELDRDNLYGGVKVLLDVLRPMTYDAKTGKALHKRGLGVIRDDRPELCELVVEQVKIGRKDAPRTVIVVEEMPRVH
ncbi:MAG: hypothetical protein E7K72_24735 [Roseomonas mucosa]|nr:hypothetical protein [Roseomonas mucosa]